MLSNPFLALDIYVFYVYTESGKQKEVSAYMPKTPKQIIKLLEQHGFVYVSANGSHAKYHNRQLERQQSFQFMLKI